ncbi:nitroreductase [Clostridium botulinum C]|uniref:nitroreductase n=1 Tax=Clostridium botulinum TaxID=1491 RepID=UPI001E33F9DC|nr:nitroreductase [Clostridium botulinum]MCD3217798.1 nitroreductase [Clostridium botulinum C]
MVDKKKFTRFKKKVEDDLRSYPYWLIAIETPNLGYPTRWGGEASTGNNINSFVEENAFDDIEKERKVNTITKVLRILDSKTKELVEKWYFRDMYTRSELLRELNIDKNKFYLYRDRALEKFMIALKYI